MKEVKIDFMEGNKKAMSEIKNILEAPAVFYELLKKCIELHGISAPENCEWAVVMPRLIPEDVLPKCGYIIWRIRE